MPKKSTTTTPKHSAPKHSAPKNSTPKHSKKVADVVETKTADKEPVNPNKTKKAPTPKRKEQEKKNVRPIVGGATAKHKKLTKEEKSEQKQIDRKKYADLRSKEVEAMKTGDQKFLPEKDKGEAKKFVREQVDSKRSPLEFFLLIALALIIFSMVAASALPEIAFAVTVLAYVYLILSGIWAYIKSRKIKQLAEEKFARDSKFSSKGLVGYALNRMTQPRFVRMPKVGV
jgi:hypothetical protein